MKVFWATKLRGFFRHLSERNPDVDFIDNANYYETNSFMSLLKSRLIRSHLLDPLGVFQVIEAKGKDCDCYGSSNRFLNSDKPYFIYLENPTALYHYTLGRISYPAGKKKFNQCLNDKNLRYIVCMSDACRDTFEKINVKVPEGLKFRTIYPFVPDNKNVSKDTISQKSKGEYLECLFCVQGTHFVSKGGLEVLTAVENLQKNGNRIHLTVITKIDDLNSYALARINEVENVTLHDFDYSYQELEKVYAKTNVLIQPASIESFGLTVLEAMKGGCAVIASKLYAFPEMVQDGYNGYLVEPKFWFFDKNNIPNPKVWEHRKRTIFSLKESQSLIKELEDKIALLSQDRELLERLSLNSFESAHTKFGEETISEQWKDVWQTLKQED